MLTIMEPDYLLHDAKKTQTNKKIKAYMLRKREIIFAKSRKAL